MSIEATADALVAQEAAPVEISPEEELGAVFDKLNEAPTEDHETPAEPEQPEAEPVEAVEEPETPPEPEVEVPSGLPVELRDKWKAIPEEAREAKISEIASRPAVVTQAKKNIESRKRMAESVLDGLDLGAPAEAPQEAASE